MRDDEAVDVNATVQDDMQMMAETEMPHPFETRKVPQPFETEAPTTTQVTLQVVTEVSDTNDVEVTHPVETKVIDLASTKLFVHTN